MKKFFERSALVIRGVVMFKDWPAWLAGRLGMNRKTGLGTFRLRNGVTFVIDYSTGLLSTIAEVWLMDRYEEYYRIQRGDTVIDIGAHIGAFAVLAVYRGAAVYTYEPTPASFALLERNSKPFDMIHPYQLAVADAHGDLTLFEVGGQGSSGNTIVAADVPSGAPATGVGISVRATTLAEIFADNHLERCDLLKLDCEGAETKILAAAPPEVFRKIKNIAMEYHYNLEEVKSILAAKGCHILEIRGGELGYLWANGAE